MAQSTHHSSLKVQSFIKSLEDLSEKDLRKFGQKALFLSQLPDELDM